MGRNANIAQLRQAAELARDRGVTVRFDAGWSRNGRAGLRPVGHVNHTTEDRSQLSEPRMREVLRNGHGSISGNAICNAAIMRSAELWVIAAGVAWHAGRGSWKGHGGNSRWLGTEYQRSRGRPLSADQLDVGRIWDWALMQAFGWPPGMVPDHFDYAGARKQDRQLRDGVRIDSAAWRRSLTEPGGELDPEPDRRREEHVMRQGDTDDDFGARVITDWQHFCNRFLYETHPLVVTHPDLRHVEAMDDLGGQVWQSEGVRGSNLNVDGEFGAKTRGASWQVIVRTGHILGHSVPGRGEHYGQDVITATVQALAATALDKYRRGDLAA